MPKLLPYAVKVINGVWVRVHNPKVQVRSKTDCRFPK